MRCAWPSPAAPKWIISRASTDARRGAVARRIIRPAGHLRTATSPDISFWHQFQLAQDWMCSRPNIGCCRASVPPSPPP